MEKDYMKVLHTIFESIEIHPEYATTPIKITKYNWNGNIEDFRIEYFVKDRKVVFHYNQRLAADMGTNFLNLDPFQQLEKEVKYVKRMYERGIGAKEYYPFTEFPD